MLTFIIVVLAAIIFEYSNGFHDAANAIATVVSTKVLTPRQAIAMAALFNLTGALFGGAVASTIGKGFGGHKCGDDDHGALRAHRCVCLEYCDLVGRDCRRVPVTRSSADFVVQRSPAHMGSGRC